jgi:hypothetical protein
VVIHNFNVFWSTFRPFKTHAELVVDSDAMLASTITLQRFETIAWRAALEIQSRRRIEHLEFALCNFPKGLKFTDRGALKKRLRVPAFEAFDHGLYRISTCDKMSSCRG